MVNGFYGPRLERGALSRSTVRVSRRRPLMLRTRSGSMHCAHRACSPGHSVTIPDAKAGWRHRHTPMPEWRGKAARPTSPLRTPRFMAVPSSGDWLGAPPLARRKGKASPPGGFYTHRPKGSRRPRPHERCGLDSAIWPGHPLTCHIDRPDTTRLHCTMNT